MNETTELLQRSLRALLEITGAARGYLSVENLAPGEEDERSQVLAARGLDEAGEILARDFVSQGIVRATLDAGEAIYTPSAVEDERFGQRRSVRERGIGQVLCLPLGEAGDAEPCGVVFLEGPSVSLGAEPFTAEQQKLAFEFAQRMVRVVRRLLSERAAPKRAEPVPIREQFPAPGVVGNSAAIERVLDACALAAKHPRPIVLLGPSGTGKTAIAKALHIAFGRPGRFVPINGATLNHGVMQSDFFGIEGRSAANMDPSEGRIREADKGTLFVDEAGELNAEMQASLLTTIETGEYRKVSGRRLEHVDVCWIFATNKDLDQASRNNEFRRDLYNRLFWRIEMPPLNDRREDIPAIVNELSRRIAAEMEAPALPVTLQALDSLQLSDWSDGNIRELEQVLFTANARARRRGAREVEFQDLMLRDVEEPAPDDFKAAMLRFKHEWIRQRLEQHDGNIQRTAEAIGMSRGHLYELTIQLGLRKPKP